MDKISIVGGGLVGSLAAVYMAQKGHEVNVFELRPDIRTAKIGVGRSINLSLSDRGIKALAGINATEDLMKIAIPMNGRVMHAVDGSLTFQSYGKDEQAIYSISRTDLNAFLIRKADSFPNVTFNFEHKCSNVDLDTATLAFDYKGAKKTFQSDVIFGTDGAFSAVRRKMQRQDRFSYSQEYLEHGYKELCIPADANGKHQIEKNALHIWPRGEFMLIALPNLDGSFTCTLFLPYEGVQSFESLNNDAAILNFFEDTFPDALALMPSLLEDFKANPTASLCTIKCWPWSYEDKACLLGDSSHGIVPFYGQGMNAGFEDLSILEPLMDEHNGDWKSIFKALQTERKPNTDAIADLALRNFIEMRDLTANPEFLLRKKIENRFYEKYPEKWMPLYSMVTFSHIPYSNALAEGKKQDQIMAKVMALPNIESIWDSQEVEEMMLLK
jgi:kynurenine 3-monooxygenase